MAYPYTTFIKPTPWERLATAGMTAVMLPFAVMVSLLPIWGLRAMALSALWSLYAVPLYHAPSLRWPAALAVAIALSTVAQPTFAKANMKPYGSWGDDVLNAAVQTACAIFIGLVGTVFL